MTTRGASLSIARAAAEAAARVGNSPNTAEPLPDIAACGAPAWTSVRTNLEMTG